VSCIYIPNAVCFWEEPEQEKLEFVRIAITNLLMKLPPKMKQNAG
jgi:hypothetical protein